MPENNTPGEDDILAQLEDIVTEAAEKIEEETLDTEPWVCENGVWVMDLDEFIREWLVSNAEQLIAIAIEKDAASLPDAYASLEDEDRITVGDTTLAQMNDFADILRGKPLATEELYKAIESSAAIRRVCYTLFGDRALDMDNPAGMFSGIVAQIHVSAITAEQGREIF